MLRHPASHGWQTPVFQSKGLNGRGSKAYFTVHRKSNTHHFRRWDNPYRKDYDQEFTNYLADSVGNVWLIREDCTERERQHGRPPRLHQLLYDLWKVAVRWTTKFYSGLCRNNQVEYVHAQNPQWLWGCHSLPTLFLVALLDSGWWHLRWAATQLN